MIASLLHGSLLVPLGFRLAVAAFAPWECKHSRVAHCSRRSASASLSRHSPHGNASIPAWLIARAARLSPRCRGIRPMGTQAFPRGSLLAQKREKGPPPAVMNPLYYFYFVSSIIISLLLATNLLMASGSRGACCRSAKS